MHPQPGLTLAEEVRAGLTNPEGMTLPAMALYDEIGSALFDTITLLPEYGLTRADVRLLRKWSPAIARLSGASHIVELGSGSGTKTRILLSAFSSDVIYCPVDVSAAALERCRTELSDFVVAPIHAEFLPGLQAAASRRNGAKLLVAFLGSNIGNFRREAIPDFLSDIRSHLESGDTLLVGADLVKPAPELMDAYDDPTGVTAAFNRNLLARLNREFDANFHLRCFDHEVRWNAEERRVEMHLRAVSDQRVRIEKLGLDLDIRSGETIWTESSHKFEIRELTTLAVAAGFESVEQYTDEEWPFAELLFRAK
jgi:L-histidine Nalpha-methyltransferase